MVNIIHKTFTIYIKQKEKVKKIALITLKALN